MMVICTNMYNQYEFNDYFFLYLLAQNCLAFSTFERPKTKKLYIIAIVFRNKYFTQYSY